ncbi:AMP-binding protein [Oscillatoria sp. CS-180]|uniref:AMP-dependent synthetase/ligase n=1 Tax=Oscillatoria sp. CS-180 TaxID=3021720 RepID=UPI00232CF9AC|nr:AMP-binding protein [Oscillatoria sp. CS-180]MDB9525756.1 AMP-binding protein [Oscillatoria sp. CS-180]
MSQIAPQILNTLERYDQAGIAAERDYSQVKSLPEIWPMAAAQYGSQLAMDDPHNQPSARISYQDLWDKIRQFAAGLQSLGMAAHAHVALFADNSHRWFVADQGVMAAGGIDAVRSAQAETEELRYIADHSDSTILIVDDLKLWQRLRDRVSTLPIQFVVLLSDEQPTDDSPFKIINYQQLLAIGSQHTWTPVPVESDSLATLIYTSGTTGKPKGVMITHRNLLHQITTLGSVVQPQQGDRVLGLLPTWHTFGRTAEYFLYSQGCTQTYTNIRNIKSDFRDVKPQYMVGVPRIWESIYEGAQKKFREQPASKQKLVNTLMWFSQKHIENQRTTNSLSLDHPDTSPLRRLGSRVLAILFWPGHVLGEKLVYSKVREATGGQVKQLISGGGSLARHIDLFFEIVNVPILVGYGLTETSPVVSARRPWRNLRGASGQPIPGTEFRIVDPDTWQTLPIGKKGLVLVRGPQIMRGYYKNPEATQKAIDSDGWFNTGDLGYLTADNNIVLTGRAKDTIVLTNGENIEPQPIEDVCVQSAYIDQMMLVGQDQRSLGALIVPNLDALQQWAASQSLHLDVPGSDFENSQGFSSIALEDDLIQKLYRAELNRQVKDRPGYRPDDRIGPFRLVTEPFSIENGMMTQTLKIKRPVVAERYRDMINGMFA